MTPGQAAEAWVTAWSDGWRHHDPDVIAARYADNAEFLSQPFRPITHGPAAAADYTRDAFAQERSTRFVFGEPIVADNGRAAVEYRAVIEGADGSTSTLAGTTVLRFDADGLVTEHRDYWAIS